MENQPQQKDGVAEVAAPVGKPKGVVYDNARSKTVKLGYPFTIDGDRVESVTIRRATGVEVAEYIGRVVAGQNAKPPVLECSQEVYDALDDDDLFEVDKVIEDFLPQRLRAVTKSTPATSAKS